jgi:hypothetical protein
METTLSTDATLSNPFMVERFRHNSNELKKLLRLWVDCPAVVRSNLAPGVAQFSQLSNNAAKYEAVRYPHIFFQFLCNSAILALERGETLDDGTKSSLLTAWTAVQLSIHLTNELVSCSPSDSAYINAC